MTDNRKQLDKFGIKVPKLMLPSDNKGMEKWAVIACDQYTSQKDYWQSVKDYSAGYPSTLNLIFPECYLEDPDPEKRIASINNAMNEYISNSVLSDPIEGFILVKRDTPKTKNRWGLMAALDLEKYDFSKVSTSLIRATEGTILDRIPPRVKIRENAALELPHIMVLIDDRDMKVIEPLINDVDSFEKVYDFDLMMDSGRLTGYRITSEKHISQIAEAVNSLGSPDTLITKYGSGNSFVFAMGDGNHSLATAKTIWENYKKDNAANSDIMEHPSRWALVELVNIFSDGIEFEAIHRVLFNASPENFLKILQTNPDFKLTKMSSLDELISSIETINTTQICGYSTAEGYGTIEALNPDSSIAAGTIQTLIDNYLKTETGAAVDYIHGIDVTDKLGRKPGNVGIFLPSIAKDTFFQTVINDGAFPRKTFSMGEAFEKRFYMETRKIK